MLLPLYLLGAIALAMAIGGFCYWKWPPKSVGGG